MTEQLMNMSTEVLIIGNGPSAITLSYMLAGHWPKISDSVLHPDDLLKARFAENCDSSLVIQDLETLCDGLEGRSPNPVSLLFDALNHPNADLGLNYESCLQWEFSPELAIDHLVVGQEAPGGCWQRMSGHVKTLSYASWMQLPDLDFIQWLRSHRHKSIKPTDRANLIDVRDYYVHYVKRKDLCKHFINFSKAVSVQRIDPASSNGCNWAVTIDRLSWELDGDPECIWDYCHSSLDHAEPGRYIHVTQTVQCKHLVLATGANDRAKILGVDGEASAPHVYFSAVPLLHCPPSLPDRPIIVIGCGSSAADAVLACLSRGLHVTHIFRRRANDPRNALAKFPPTLYKEYHRVFELMQGKVVHDLYTPVEDHSIVRFQTDTQMVVARDNLCECETSFPYTMTIIQIGAMPLMRFLHSIADTIAVNPTQPLDNKNNCVDVDPYSCQVTSQPKLYAIGPLIGDNFVRFVQGGALAVVNHIVRNRSKSDGT